MSVRRVVLSSLMVSALALVACVVADDFSDGAVLGPAEPIGKLLVVKASFDDELAPASPVPLPPDELRVFASPAEGLAHEQCAVPAQGAAWRETAISPPVDEIPYHLKQAILRLSAAGLNDEAKQVSTLLQDFQTKHAPRLLLATRQAQLNELQAEIDRLKLRVEKGITSDRVAVAIKIIEVDDGDARKLLKDISLAIQPDKQKFQELMTRIQDAPGVRVLTSPTLVVLSGRTGKVTSDGKLPTPGIALVGGPEEFTFGTTVTATPTITEKDQVRLQFEIELCEMDETNGVTLNGKFVPGITRRRVQPTVDLKDGQTLIIGGFASTRKERNRNIEKETFITVTVEMPQPYDADEFRPLVLPANVLPQPAAQPLIE